MLSNATDDFVRSFGVDISLHTNDTRGMEDKYRMQSHSVLLWVTVIFVVSHPPHRSIILENYFPSHSSEAFCSPSRKDEHEGHRYSGGDEFLAQSAWTAI